MKEVIILEDEAVVAIWDNWVVNCFKDTSIEDAVREWLKLYKDIRPELLGNATKRKTVFDILEQSNLLPDIENIHNKFSTYGFTNRTFVKCLERILDDVEDAIRKEIGG